MRNAQRRLSIDCVKSIISGPAHASDGSKPAVGTATTPRATRIAAIDAAVRQFNPSRGARLRTLIENGPLRDEAKKVRARPPEDDYSKCEGAIELRARGLPEQRTGGRGWTSGWLGTASATIHTNINPGCDACPGNWRRRISGRNACGASSIASAAMHALSPASAGSAGRQRRKRNWAAGSGKRGATARALWGANDRGAITAILTPTSTAGLAQLDMLICVAPGIPLDVAIRPRFVLS